MTVLVVRTISDYPPGLIGTVAALFGRSISASHGVDWTLEAMVAEQQCEFFRRFRPDHDRVWVAMESGIPRGALTIEGPTPEDGREAARLRFFILDDSLRGRGLGRRLVAKAMCFCRERGYRRVYLTTLAGLDAAQRLYEEQGFSLISESTQAFHGSGYAEQVLEWRDGSQ